MFFCKCDLGGEFFGDVRVVSGETNLSSNTNRDLIIISGKVFSDEKTILNGKTLIVGGEVDLKGKILDDIKIIAGKVNIDADILADVEITSQKVTIGENAKIDGEFVYFCSTKCKDKIWRTNQK